MEISECICGYKDSRFSFEHCVIIPRMTQGQYGNNYLMLLIQWSFQVVSDMWSFKRYLVARHKDKTAYQVGSKQIME